MKKRHFKLRPWVKLVFILIVLFCSLFFYSRYINTKGIKVKEYSIIDSNIPSNFYGFKIVHFSDIHYKVTTDLDDLEKIVEKINILKPDIIIFSGDIFDKEINYTKKDYEDLTKIFKSINYNIGKFAIKGDNDIDNDNWDNIINNSDFTNLNDTYKLVYYEGNDPILLTGVSSNLKNNHIEVINDIENNYKYSILVIHEPDYIDSSINYNLILAGHSLNGRIVLPYVGGIIKDKGAIAYYREYYKLKNSDLYISSGIGTSIYKFRFLNTPSINFYRLRNK